MVAAWTGLPSESTARPWMFWAKAPETRKAARSVSTILIKLVLLVLSANLSIAGGGRKNVTQTSIKQ